MARPSCSGSSMDSSYADSNARLGTSSRAENFRPSPRASEDDDPEQEPPWKGIYENFTTIDWISDLRRDKLRNRKMAARRQGRWDPIGLFEDAQSWLLVFLVGITIGFAASWIDIVAAWLTDVRMGFCGTDWYLPKNVCCTGIHDRDGGCDDWWDWGYAIFGIRHLYPIKWVFYVAISTILAGSCTVLVCQLAPYAAGSGSPEIKTILGGFIIKGYLGIETLVIKLVGLPLAVSSGLAIGKEGPMIHVACCIGNIFPRFFPKYARNEARKREILSAAAATGVGVAFGAPIGGVLFSLEELSSYFPSKTLLRSYFCALVGSVTLQVVDPYRGKRVMYQVTYTRNWHYFELIFFVVLGVFGGLSGALFIRLNMLAQAYRQSSWLKNYPMREVVSIAMATAALCYFDIFTRVDSSELLEYLFKECNESDFFGICDKSTTASTIFLLVFALLLRISLSIITFGVKVPAGIFIPSMVWGALFGRMLGIIVESWQQAHKTFPLFSTCHPEEPCVTPGMYALLGAIAALGGVTRLTLSLTVIMFELTGTLDYIIPCMVTLMVTKLVGDFFGKGGLTDILIRWKQYPYLDPHDEELIGLSAEKVMTPASELVCLTGTGMTVDIIDRLLHEMDFKGFPVIQSTEDKILIGYISRTDLRNTLDHVRLTRGIARDAPVFLEDVPASTKYGSVNGGGSGFGYLGNSTIVDGQEQLSSVAEFLDVASFVDVTPITVHPKVPIERVIDIFKKIGPRYILVCHHGRIHGLITKKDILAVFNEGEEGLGWYGAGLAQIVASQSGHVRLEEDHTNSPSDRGGTHPGRRRQRRPDSATPLSAAPKPMTAAQVMRARQIRHVQQMRADIPDNGEITPSVEGIVDPLFAGTSYGYLGGGSPRAGVNVSSDVENDLGTGGQEGSSWGRSWLEMLPSGVWRGGTSVWNSLPGPRRRSRQEINDFDEEEVLAFGLDVPEHWQWTTPPDVPGTPERN